MAFSFRTFRLSSSFAGLSLLLLLATTLSGCATRAASQGYLYGFPLVLMDETKEHLTGDERVCGFGADINRFAHILDIPGPDFQVVVRPNVDTLYSSAMLDLSAGPMQLDMPEVDDNRYVLMALLDGWSNNFAGLGTQTNNNKESHYLIVGPDWQGEDPDDLEVVRSPTNLVWIVGRVEVKDRNDIPAANAVQKQLKLTPYGHQLPAPAEDIQCVDAKDKTAPEQLVKDLSGPEFFARLADLMRANPPLEWDGPMIERLRDIQVSPQRRDAFLNREGLDLGVLERGRDIGQWTIGASENFLALNKGWSPSPERIKLGEYRDRYLVRAVVAEIGFGANRNEFATYQNTVREEKGLKLKGTSDYTIHFPAGELPPVDAFWSITAYSEDGYLVANAAAEAAGITRYALGTNSGLVTAEDGSVTLYLSHHKPEGVPLNNWLPVPEGRFALTLRLYAPQEAILEGDWKTPPVKRVRGGL